MKKNILIPFICLLTAFLVACGTTTHIEQESSSESKNMKYIEKETLKDTIIYVQVPYEKVVEVTPKLDTLHLETSLAVAYAWLDSCTNTLKGELRNKETALKNNIKIPTKTIQSVVNLKTQQTKTITRNIIKNPSLWQKSRYILFGIVIGMIITLLTCHFGFKSYVNNKLKLC